MTTIRVISHVDSNGLVQIQLPEHHNEKVEILLTYKPVQAAKKRQWSQRFLDIQGAWQGQPLKRGSQGIQSERDPLV